MKKEQRMRITVSKDEVTIIRKLQGIASANCHRCQARVEMATPEQIVTLTGIHSRTIYSWVESGQVHFLETAEGHLLICLASLHTKQQAELQKPALPP